MKDDQKTGDEAPQTVAPVVPATDQAKSAATGEQTESVTLSQKDYNELIAQRDRANENLKKSGGTDDLVLEMYKEKEISSFLKTNAEKYPDVEPDDLMYLDDPAQMDEAAAKMQRRVEDRAQKKLAEIQVADNTPRLTEQQKSEQIEALKGGNAPDRFEQMLKIRSS